MLIRAAQRARWWHESAGVVAEGDSRKEPAAAVEPAAAGAAATVAGVPPVEPLKYINTFSNKNVNANHLNPNIDKTFKMIILVMHLQKTHASNCFTKSICVIPIFLAKTMAIFIRFHNFLKL